MSLTIDEAERIARGGHRVHYFETDDKGRLVRITLEPVKAPGGPIKRTERVVPPELATVER